MAFRPTPTLAWVLLLVAGLLEIVWTAGMKASEGFTRPLYTGLTLATALASFWLLGKAIEVLPMGTAYAVWTGIGAVGAAIVGMLLFGESASAARLLCIALIVAGIFGLKVLP